MEISITKTTSPKAKTPVSELGFGRLFSDHMFIMDYELSKGWHNARIVPFADLSIHPAACALHYGAEIFEGMKAYKGDDGQVLLFRPEANFARMNRSAAKLCLPQLDEEACLQGLKALLRVDADWIPDRKGSSLYVRPFVLGTEPILSVAAPNRMASFYIILSPSGNYYAEGLNPVSILVEREEVRAVRGGTGTIKCGGNYAASNHAGDKAYQKGFSQVLWLDGVEQKYIEEVGSMNVMFKIDGKIVTPKLSGSILPGITRMSVLEICRSWGIECEERLISLDELLTGLKNGRVEEAFGCGTAAVISPIGRFAVDEEIYLVNGGQIGSLSQKLYDEITGIQWGTRPDPFGWRVEL